MSLLDALLLDAAPFDYYIAFRGDNVGGSGTINDPWDGSTTDKFDKIMRDNIPANARIHIGPGTFLTKGFYDGASSTYGWQVKAGWKIIGSGIDVTTVKIDGATTAQPHFFAIAHALNTGGSPDAANPMDFCEVSDLTVDCALSAGSNTGSGAFGAIRLMGNHVKVSRVKAKHWGTKDTAKPCFVISVITADKTVSLIELLDAGIEGCIVTDPDGADTGPAVALHAGTTEKVITNAEGNGSAPFIRSCLVDCGTVAAAPEYRGISMSWCRGAIIQSNQVHNTTFGVFQGQAHIAELTVRGNVFKNVLKGALLGNLSGNLISSGTLALSHPGSTATVPLAGSNNLLAVGDKVRITTSPSSGFDGIHEVTGVSSTGFDFSTSVSGTATVNLVSKVFGVDNLIVEGNVIEMAAQSTGDVKAMHIDDKDLAQDATYPAYFHGNVVLWGNKVRYRNGQFDSGYVGYATQVNGAKNAIVEDNVVEAAPPNPLKNLRCGAIQYFNNSTPAGVFIPDASNYNGLEAEAEDALVLALI